MPMILGPTETHFQYTKRPENRTKFATNNQNPAKIIVELNPNINCWVTRKERRNSRDTQNRTKLVPIAD